LRRREQAEAEPARQAAVAVAARQTARQRRKCAIRAARERCSAPEEPRKRNAKQPRVRVTKPQRYMKLERLRCLGTTAQPTHRVQNAPNTVPFTKPETHRYAIVKRPAVKPVPNHKHRRVSVRNRRLRRVPPHVVATVDRWFMSMRTI